MQTIRSPRFSAVRQTSRPRRSAERTRALFLNAAEAVFGAHGYEGTTIRAIAKRARVNLGTLQHYWGSKRQLFRELFVIRFEPLRADILRRLRAIEERSAGDSRPDAGELLRALIESTFLIGMQAPGDAGVARPRSLKPLRRLYGRALMDPSAVIVAELNRLFREPVELFLALMRRACPQLSAGELDWRVNCIVGAQGFSLVYSERVGRFFGGEADVEARRAADWMIHFMLNGIHAPAFAEATQAAHGLDGTAHRA